MPAKAVRPRKPSTRTDQKPRTPKPRVRRRVEVSEDHSDPGGSPPASPTAPGLSRDEIKKRLLWLAAGKPGNGPA